MGPSEPGQAVFVPVRGGGGGEDEVPWGDEMLVRQAEVLAS